MNDGNGSTTHSSKKRCEWVAHFEAIFGEAKKVLPESEARDVATTACIAAFLSDRKMPLPRDLEGVSRWRAKYLYWRLRTHWSRTSKQRKKSAIMVDALAQISIDHTPPSADIVLDRLEIMNALKDLCSEDQTLALDVHVHGYSSTEIAARYGLPIKTIQKRIARATENLGRAIRRRRAGVWHGFGGFLFALDFRKQSQEFISSALRWLFHPSATSHAFGMYTMGAVMFAFMPADLVRPVPSLNPNPYDGPGPLIPFGASPVHTTIPVDTVIAPQDKPTPTISAIVLPPKPPTREPTSTTPPQEKPPTVAAPPAPTTTLPPNPAPPQRPAVDPANTMQTACSNAFAEAQTAMNLRRNPRACLEHLNQKPTRTDTCPETLERKLLRQRCLDKLTP